MAGYVAIILFGAILAILTAGGNLLVMISFKVALESHCYV